MAILLFILRLIGWVLLALLLLVLVALLLPLGIRFSYRPGQLRLEARFGPLHFTLWPRKGQETPANPKTMSAQPAAPQTVTAKTAEGEKAAVTVQVKSDSTASQPAPKRPAAPEKKTVTPKDTPVPPPPGDETSDTGDLPFGISERIDAAMQLLSDDPMAFAKCMLGHTRWLGRQLLRFVRITHLTVFWTVTADEASATAELYGAEMTLLNNLLAFVQQYVRLQSDRLWLEPDFTGERAGERIVSFRLLSCAAVLLWLVLRLLHRLWKDPQLQPAAPKP